MRNQNRTAVALTLALVVLPPVARAQEGGGASGLPSSAAGVLVLTLAEAQQRALRENPTHLAERQAVDIAAGELRQARTYRYNPELELEAPGGARTGFGSEYEASLTQEIEYGGQWGLRVKAAEIGVERARFNTANAERSVLARVTRAYYKVLAVERRLDVTSEALALNERLLEATRTQLQEGEISELESNLAEIELGRARARVLRGRRELERAELELKQEIGVAPDRPIQLAFEEPAPLPVATLEQGSLVALAFARRPDMAAANAALSRAETLRRLAGREALPNLRVGLLAEREAEPRYCLDSAGAPSLSEIHEKRTRIGLGASFSLPLWNRNQGVRGQRSAEVRESAFLRSAMELAVRTEVTDAYRGYQAASEEVEVFEREVRAPVRQNEMLLETAYRAGKLDLVNLLFLRNQLLETELGYWDAWLARQEALVDLEAATGTLQIVVGGSER